MAFTTINGASATDAVSFVGTDGNDAVVTFSTLTAFVGAQAGADSITASNVNGLVNWQLKAGADNDNVTFNSAMIGGRVNGNAGSDVIKLGKVLEGAAVFGGQNNDAITANVVANSRINGNLGEDVITIGTLPLLAANSFAPAVTPAVQDDPNTPTVNEETPAKITKPGVGADVLFASIFGGQGNDIINVATDNIQSSVIDGNLGNDTINLYFDRTATVAGVTVNGGEGDDTLNSFALSDLTEKGGSEGITFDGGAGDDTINATGRNDTIEGGAGNDTIEGRGGADTISGGLGNNIFKVDQANQTWIQGTGTDVIEATDVITDWKTSDKIAFGTSGANGPVVGTDFFGFNGTVYKTLFDAIAASAGNTDAVTLVAVGTATSATAYAVVIDAVTNIVPTTGTYEGIGAIQLGATGIYRDTNIGAVMSANNVVDYAA